MSNGTDAVREARGVGITPGPWEVYKPRVQGATYGIDGADGTAVVWHGDNQFNGIRRVEDARLIAAAPDLLYIARQLLLAYEVTYGDDCPLAEQAREVISRATNAER